MKRTLEPQDQISRYHVVGPLGAGGDPVELTRFTEGVTTGFA